MPTTIELPPETALPPKRSRRRRTLQVSLGVLGALAVATGSLAIANQVMKQHDRSSFTVDEVRALVVEVDSGHVTLVPTTGAEGQVDVDSTMEWAWSRPDTGHVTEDGVLTITADCPAVGLGTCSVDHRIGVPAGIDVDVTVSSGNITVAGLDLSVVDLSTDSGDISATDMSVPEFHGRTSSGNVMATFIDAPDQVTAESSSGNVNVTVPDEPYDVEADTSSGDVRVDVNDDPDASRHISANTSSGNVTIDRR